MRLSLCFILMAVFATSEALAVDRCALIFDSNDLFPSVQELRGHLASNPDERAWRQLNRRLDRLYVTVERTDFLKTATEVALASTALRIIELQRELESPAGSTSGSTSGLRDVFADSQQDTLQDVKGLIFAELRSRGRLKEMLSALEMERELLVQFGLRQTDPGQRK